MAIQKHLRSVFISTLCFLGMASTLLHAETIINPDSHNQKEVRQQEVSERRAANRKRVAEIDQELKAVGIRLKDKKIPPALHDALVHRRTELKKERASLQSHLSDAVIQYNQPAR